MRVREITFTGKKITLREKRIKELKSLYAELNINFDGIFKTEAKDLVDTLINILGDKINLIAEGITKEDIEEAYPSDLEELIGAFIDINFFGLKKVISPLLQLRAQS
jgi:hypothetical protein